jgi:hypothetical protein
MSSNADTIVQEIRQELESMLTYVKDSKTQTADQVERTLFRRVLALGYQLLVLFFALRAETYPRTPVENAAGEQLPYFAERKRDYFSIFGKISLLRPYFYRSGVGGKSPLDAELSLGADCYSDMVRELAEYLGVDATYEKVTALFAHLLGQSLAKNAVQQMVAEDATDVIAYYEQKAPPPPESEGSILVVQADGKGLPMVRETPAPIQVRRRKGDKRTKKKEAIVTGIYTIDPSPRTPEAVVASLFHDRKAAAKPDDASPRHKPHHKQLWATLAGKDTALERLAQQVVARDGAHITHRVALTDGADALQRRVLHHCPDFTLILDFIHANEYLWDVANRLFTEKDPQREAWVETHTLHILSGQTAQVITEFRSLAQAPKTTKAQREQLEKTANYFERNLAYMAYQHYLAQGWPIASGVIEGACRHVVKDRFELSGMRWTRPGAEHLLHLRAVAVNGHWDDYHRFRKHQRHLRLYTIPFPEQPFAEDQALNDLSRSSDKIIRLDAAAQCHSSHHQPNRIRKAA